MQLSIIVVNYRSWELLGELLTDLVACESFRSGRWEVIVVDNHSDDERLDAFARRFPAVRFVVNEDNLGFAHGNNLGARNASGDTLLFMNPDMRASEENIEVLWRCQREAPALALLTGLQQDAGGRLQKAFDRFPDLLGYFRTVRNLARVLAPRRNPDPRRPPAELVYCDWISGSLVLISRANFERLGGWSEDFWMYAEDMDLCRRAADQGLARALTTRARFVHHHGGASRRNEATTVLTKSEVLISAHVYISRHFSGAHAGLNHLIVLLRDLPPLCLAAVLNLLTFGRLRSLAMRGRILRQHLGYLRRVPGRRSWLSPRAPNFPVRDPRN